MLRLVDCHAKQFIAASPEDFTDTPVSFYVSPFHVADEHADGELVDEGFEQVPLDVAFNLSLLALGDVLPDASQLDGFAGLVRHDLSHEVSHSYRAVGPDDAMLEGEGLVIAESLLVNPLH